MPIRHRADFKEALSTLRRLKNEEDRAYYQNWERFLVASLISDITATMDPTLMER